MRFKSDRFSLDGSARDNVAYNTRLLIFSKVTCQRANILSILFSNLVTGVSETTANIGCDLLEALLKKVVCTTSTDLICHGVSLVFATLWRLASMNQSGKESENRIGDGDGTDEREIRQVKTFQSQKLGEVIQLLEKHLKRDLKPSFPSYRGQDITTELKVSSLKSFFKIFYLAK